MIWALVAAAVTTILLMPFGYLREKRIWNNGVSEQSGTPWVYFDRDSQGGRGYKDSADNYVWISYPFIDAHKVVEVDE